jgi:hypothetical protein
MANRKLTARLLLQIINEGYDVYMSNDKQWQSYCYYTDGKNIAYLQCGNFGGFSISTVHKPNKNSGTGFRMPEIDSYYPTNKDLKSAFCIAPNWANNTDRQSVVKYKDFKEFTEKRLSGSDLFKLTKEDATSLITTIGELHACKSYVDITQYYDPDGRNIKSVKPSQSESWKLDITFNNGGKRINVNNTLKVELIS